MKNFIKYCCCYFVLIGVCFISLSFYYFGIIDVGIESQNNIIIEDEILENRVSDLDWLFWDEKTYIDYSFKQGDKYLCIDIS